MLGYNLHPRASGPSPASPRTSSSIRLTASAQLGRTACRPARRPVQFRSSIGAAGNDQALDILREAATRPASTRSISRGTGRGGHALPRRKPRAHQAVIVDIGGGTTDIAHAEVGGDAAPRIHRAWGIARGGTDIDLALSLSSYAAVRPRHHRVPAHHYVEAATVQDMTASVTSASTNTITSTIRGALQALQDTGNTARLYRDVERAKIALSAASEHRTARWTTLPATCMPTAAPPAWPLPLTATWNRSGSCWPRSAATLAATRMRCSDRRHVPRRLPAPGRGRGLPGARMVHGDLAGRGPGPGTGGSQPGLTKRYAV